MSDEFLPIERCLMLNRKIKKLTALCHHKEIIITFVAHLNGQYICHQVFPLYCWQKGLKAQVA